MCANEFSVNEITLPLSQFNSRDFSFLDYVSGLTSTSESGLSSTLQCLQFEKVLKSVDFPDLNSPTAIGLVDDIRKDHREIEVILDWLYEKKGVREIINLKVPDRLYSPHQASIVRRFVKQFKVENLDWRRLDLHLTQYDDDWNPLPPDWAASLKRLSLYSSGDSSVHDHWLSELGKLNAQGLQAVDIMVVEVSTNTAFLLPS